METVATLVIDLFADNLPSLEQIRTLSEYVNSSEKNRIAFRRQLEENMSKTGRNASLAQGIGLFILGRNVEAAEKLSKGRDCKEKCLYQAYAMRRIKRYDEAIKCFDESLAHGAERLEVGLEKACTYRHAENFDAAAKELKACSNFRDVSPEYHYQLARLNEAQGLYDEAIASYKTALKISPNHQRSLFHLAFRCDLSGQEEAAIDYYKQIVNGTSVSVSALLNLAVLYEDSDRLNEATQCVDMVLESYPNHGRALLFKKDIESSKTMFYDEEKEKKKSRKNQILETPISDFELSVRSRNCLKKMKIETLGDLLNITEAELLSYKNFGETSLREIKAILDPKGLTLGMALEDKTPEMEEPAEQAGPDENEAEGLRHKSVDDLKLSVRARKCLQKLNLRTIGELTSKTEAELLGCKNFGVTSLNEINKALGDLGISLRNLD